MGKRPLVRKFLDLDHELPARKEPEPELEEDGAADADAGDEKEKE